eukprot:11057112-Alexandrium_andersonii.AAC.1
MGAALHEAALGHVAVALHDAVDGLECAAQHDAVLGHSRICPSNGRLLALAMRPIPSSMCP